MDTIESVVISNIALGKGVLVESITLPDGIKGTDDLQIVQSNDRAFPVLKQLSEMFIELRF